MKPLKNVWKSVQRNWRNVPISIRKPVVLIIGSLVVIGGIILLPLPGPGWVIIFAGFALLATEFEFAERVQDWLVQVFKIGTYYLKKTWNSMRGKPTKGPAPSFDTGRRTGTSPHLTTNHSSKSKH